MEKTLRKSLNDLQLTYVDMYLIHTPFGVPETEGDLLKHDNGDIILDTDTDHIATWKVCVLIKMQFILFIAKQII